MTLNEAWEMWHNPEHARNDPDHLYLSGLIDGTYHARDSYSSKSIDRWQYPEYRMGWHDALDQPLEG